MEEPRLDVTKELTVKCKTKILHFDEQLLAEWTRDARADRAKQLHRLRQLLAVRPKGEQVGERPQSYRAFRTEYVTKLRWLHSGRGMR